MEGSLFVLVSISGLVIIAKWQYMLLDRQTYTHSYTDRQTIYTAQYKFSPDGYIWLVSTSLPIALQILPSGNPFNILWFCFTWWIMSFSESGHPGTGDKWTETQTDRQTNRLTDDKKTSAKANYILQVHVYASMGSSTKFSASSTIRCASALFSITQNASSTTTQTIFT